MKYVFRYIFLFLDFFKANSMRVLFPPTIFLNVVVCLDTRSCSQNILDSFKLRKGAICVCYYGRNRRNDPRIATFILGDMKFPDLMFQYYQETSEMIKVFSRPTRQNASILNVEVHHSKLIPNVLWTSLYWCSGLFWNPVGCPEFTRL